MAPHNTTKAGNGWGFTVGESISHSWSELRDLAISRPFRGDLNRGNFAQRLSWPTNAHCIRCHQRGDTVQGLAHYPGCPARDRDIRFRLTGQNRITAEVGRLLSRRERKPKRP